MQDGKDTTIKPKKKGRIWRRIRRILVWGIGLLLLLVLVLQSPTVQNWLAKQATKSIAKTLEARVELDNARLAWFDELSLAGIFIEDKYGDTLLYAQEIRADFNLNPLVLFKQGLEIEEVFIKSTRFVIRRDLGDPESNLAYALRKLFPPKEKKGKPLNLNLQRLGLEDIHFVQSDSVRGQLMNLTLEEAVVQLETLDLPNNQIEINSAELYHPVYHLTNFPPNPLDSTQITEESTTETSPSVEEAVKLALAAGNIEIIGGQFVLDNFRKDALADSDISAIDFARLNVRDIDLEIVDFALLQDTFTGSLKHLSLQEKSGFKLDRLSVQDLTISPTALMANQLELLTPNSRLSDTLIFKYRRGWTEWQRFEDRVRMDLRFAESQVAIRDILYFARNLRSNQFFRDNQSRKIRINGRVTGPVNSLGARNIELALDENNYLKGNFSSSDLTRKGGQFLQLELDYARTNMNTLRSLINNFNPPPSFDRLGTLEFNGRFDGFFRNFVAYGDLRTDIGRTELDMNMNLIPGAKNAIYRGDLLLENFDLGTFLANPDFGTVSLSGSVENGKGLVAETASAELNAIIDNFTFREYTYRKAAIIGQLNRNFFDGDFNIKDENIDFNFTGELDFRDSIADLNFDAQVAKLDLGKLNLSKADLVLSGDIGLNLLNTRFADMEGRLEINGVKLIKDQLEEYNIDSLLVYSNFTPDGQKILALESDIAQAEIIGDFDINQLVGSLKYFLVKNYPGYAQRLNIRPPKKIPSGNRFSYDIAIQDSKGLNYLLTPKLGPLKNVTLAGNYDGLGDELTLELSLPQFEFATLKLKDLILRLDAEGDEGDLDLAVDSTYLNGKPRVGPIALLSVVTGDSIRFGINYAAENNNLLDKLNLNGLFFLPDSNNFKIQFDSSDLAIFQERWDIAGDNSITFGKNFIDARNFKLSSGKREIRLQREGRRGLSLFMDNFALGLIDTIWDYRQLDFSGYFNVQATIGDIFKMEDISATLLADTFLMNGDDYGWMRLDASVPNLKDQVSAYMSLNRDTAQLITEALFNLQDLVPEPTRNEDRKNFLQLNVAINGYPLELADYWVGGAVSDLHGMFDAEMQVKGLTKQLDVSGFIQAIGGGFTVDYLKTHYNFADAYVNINNRMFDATGTVLRDKYGNRANVEGGISHNRLKNLGLAASLRTNKFLALDLKKEDNDLFYGRALGSGKIDFTGNFKQPNIYVRAEVGEESNLYIPASQAPEAGPISDIRFVNKKVYKEEVEEIVEESTGVSLELELLVNEQADVEIIFDEEVGDLIRGNGRGNLRIIVPRDGEMQMFGDYLISSGEYLFTFYRVVNKFFTVRPGGTVNWDGDPFGARINLQADYEKLSTPIANFIQEYLVGSDESLEAAANRATEVDLTLLLKGPLLKPDINFDLRFPELTGRLATFANNKRRLLLLDQNEINRQAFGLIVVGQFLPANLAFNGIDVGVNTLSEWASNYLSLLLNNLLVEAFGEDAFISTIDFDLAYSRFRSENPTRETASQGDVLEFTLRKSFGNRFSISGGINVQSQNAAANASNGTFIGNEFSLDYVINDARTIKLRMYQRLQPDLLTDRRLQFGLGLSWRKEFNTLREFFSNMRKDSEGTNAN
ncbi:MAG: translocation/assembly module TamB domain-containing protein [Bacteroidota bacterium]